MGELVDDATGYSGSFSQGCEEIGICAVELLPCLKVTFQDGEQFVRDGDVAVFLSLSGSDEHVFVGKIYIAKFQVLEFEFADAGVKKRGDDCIGSCCFEFVGVRVIAGPGQKVLCLIEWQEFR